jgi:hypothetical protein
MGKTDVIAAFAAGVTGAITIGIYLMISVPLALGAPISALFVWDASNLLGYERALHAGLFTDILVGQTSHLIVSVVWGFVFVLLARRVVPQMLARPILSGIAFGFVVMLVMHFVVVPLGHAPQLGYTLRSFTNNLIAHTLFFGVPVAVVAARTLRPSPGSLKAGY